MAAAIVQQPLSSTESVSTSVTAEKKQDDPDTAVISTAAVTTSISKSVSTAAAKDQDKPDDR